MLTIIQGHSGLLLAKQGCCPSVMDSAQAIYFGAERAAGLTRQLLMFSRKNVMQQKPLDLRDVVMNTSKMLMRLLGETNHAGVHSPAGDTDDQRRCRHDRASDHEPGRECARCDAARGNPEHRHNHEAY